MWTWLKGVFAAIGSVFSHAPSVEQIQNATVSACGFLPEAATVANIVAAGNPSVMTGTAIATAICTAVTAPRSPVMGLMGDVPMVAGVEIKGRFVK